MTQIAQFVSTEHRYEIHHANDIFAMVFPSAEHWLEDRAEHFTHVADVEAPLERLFALTQHTDEGGWPNHPEVAWHRHMLVRSTSVGDMFLCTETGQAWLVMPCELEEIIFYGQV
jgi:hypothetical protein